MLNTSPACIICLSAIKSPVSLPCGHVFCQVCLEQVISSIRPLTMRHQCPTCRAAYCVAMPDPNAVPNTLQLHVLRPIRKLHFEPAKDHVVEEPSASTSTASTIYHLAASTELASTPSPHSTPSSSVSPPTASTSTSTLPVSLFDHEPALPTTQALLHSGNTGSLHAQCALWRQRAELHAATTLGLVGLARMARDHALAMRRERDAAMKRCAELETTLAVLGAASKSGAPARRSVSPRSEDQSRTQSTQPEETPEAAMSLLLSPVELKDVATVHSDADSQDWMSPPAGRPIHLPPLPSTPPLSHSPSSSPHSPSPVHMYSPRSDTCRVDTPPTPTHCPECDRQSASGCSLCEDADGESDEDDEPPRKRARTESPEVALTQMGRRRSVNVADSHRITRTGKVKARRAVSQYLEGDEERKAM